MPLLTRLFVKTALVFLLAALATRIVLALQWVVALSGFLSALGPVYFHLFLVGWVTQLIFGVAYWMFPTYTRQRPRGFETLAWAAYWLLNVGLVLRTIGEPLNAVQAGNGWGWLLPVSAVLQWLAALAFIANTWPRVKER
jgi:heme/copper-type cytochrome/quinol oxidase subunit 1